jgi:energy-coupling factor transport system permease protein
MNSFKNLHPGFVLCYFVFVTFFSVFSFNPIYLVSSLMGALLFALMIQGVGAVARSIGGYFLVFFLIAVTNPLFSHNGRTALFFINDNRVTLEAFVYGVVLGVAVVSVLYWFRCFNEIFDSERYMYVFGRISPGLAVAVSMTLRFVPELIHNFKQVNNAQKCLSDNRCRLRRYISSFSAVISQSLENAVITSDSMRARGYSLRGRTSYTRFRFSRRDGIVLGIFIFFAALSVTERHSFSYYPDFVCSDFSLMSAVSCVSFGIIVLLPFLYEVREGLWKFSASRI